MIRKSSVLITLFIFTLIITTHLFASNGTQIGTVGARSTAMGSCFRGLADDWSAFFFNPAGLTQLENWTIGTSVGIIMPRGSYTPYAFPEAPFSGLYTDERDLAEQNFLVPSFGITYKVSEKITVGLAMAAPFGLGAKFDIITIPETYGNSSNLKELEETSSDHQVVNILPSFAYQVSDKFSVGASVGYIAIGSMKLNQVGLPEYTKAQPAIAPLIGLLKTAQVFDSDQERLVVENYLDGSGNAFSASLGVLYKFTDNLSVGASARYYTDLKLEGTLNRKIHLPGANASYSQTIIGYFAQVPGAQTVDSLTALGGLQMGFSGATTDTTYDADADLPLPMTLGLGIAYKPMPRLTLTADVSWTQWSSWDEIDVNLTKADRSETTTMKEDWKSTIEYGAGAEYNLLAQENLKLDLRGGFYMVDTPSPHATISPTILDPKNRTVLTGGVGVQLGKINVNIAYERVILGEEDVPQSEYVFDEIGVNENWAGKYQLNANVVTVGASITL